jgi:hypothetical protein
MGTRGAVTSATPTADLSHPIASHLVISTDDSVLGTRGTGHPGGHCAAASANDHRLLTAASITCRRALAFVP